MLLLPIFNYCRKFAKMRELSAETAKNMQCLEL